MKNYMHFIFITSNYNEGKRYGLHFVLTEENSNDVIKLAENYSRLDNVAFYTVITDDDSIESVKRKEPFFKNVDLLDSTEDDATQRFEMLFTNKLQPVDYALLILTRINCTYLDLLIYFYHVYCVYCKKHNDLLFQEKLYISPAKHMGYEIKEFTKYFNQITTCTDPEILFTNQSYNINNRTLKKLKVSKKEAVYSKFFNCDGGIEKMNEFIEILESIKKTSVEKLFDKIVCADSVIAKSDKKNTFVTSKNIKKFYKL